MKQLIERQREDFKKNKKTYWDTFGNLATNELIALHSEYLKQFIDELIAREESKYIRGSATTVEDDEFNRAKFDSVSHLKELKEELN